MIKEIITRGDRVKITGENRCVNSRIGNTGIVIREGMQGMFWLTLDCGRELVWKGKWLKKVEDNNKLRGYK